MNPPEKIKSNRNRRWVIILGTLIFLLISLGVVFHLPSFQKFSKSKLETYLNKKYDGSFTIDEMNIHIFKGLTFKDVLILDHSKDTVLFLKELSAGFKSPALTLLYKELKIDDIKINGGKINIVRLEDETKTNIDKVQFGSGENLQSILEDTIYVDDKVVKYLTLGIDRVFLDDVEIYRYDVPLGKRELFFINKGFLKINQIDIEKKSFIIDSMSISHSTVDLDSNPWDEDFWNKKSSVVYISNPDLVYHPIHLEIKSLNFLDCNLILDNYRKTPKRHHVLDAVDYEHFSLHSINLLAKNFYIDNWNFGGNLKELSGESTSGLILQSFTADTVSVTPNYLELYGVEIKTPTSLLRDSIRLTYNCYPAFEDFTNQVEMDVQFRNSRLSVADLLQFAWPLNEVPLFRDNPNQIFRFDGRFEGKVNKLRSNKFTFNNERFALNGSINSRNLAVKDEQLMNLDISSLKTDMVFVQELLGKDQVPQNFVKLGNLIFKGRYDGYFNDFVAFGDLTTNLGKVNMDMRLNSEGDKSLAQYSGQLNVENFDIGRWTGNYDFGNITFNSQVKDGRGLTQNSVEAILVSNVSSFKYKDYLYQNILINGALGGDLFDGHLSIVDRNIDLLFSGEIDYADSIPKFDFEATINKLNTKELKLLDRNLDINGDIKANFTIVNTDELLGTGEIQGLKIVEDELDEYFIDKLEVSSIDIGGNDKSIRLNSDPIDVNLVGQFGFKTIFENFQFVFQKHFPKFAKHTFKWDSIPESFDHNYDYTFYIDLKDSKNLFSLFQVPIDTMYDSQVEGWFYGDKESSKIDVRIKGIKSGELSAENTQIFVVQDKDNIESSLDVKNSMVNNMEILNANFISRTSKDSLLFALNAPNFSTIVDNINLEGKIFFEEDKYVLSLIPSDLYILNQKWEVEQDNYLKFSDDYIETQNLKFSSGPQNIVIESNQNKGLSIGLENLELNFINQLWIYEKLDIGGKLNFVAESSNIFEEGDFSFNGFMNSFYINGDDYGELYLKAFMSDSEKPLTINLDLVKENQKLSANGYSYLKPQSGKPQFDFRTDLINYPLNFFEYLLGDAISNTGGLITASCNFIEENGKPNLSGSAEVRDGTTSIDYLGTTYKMPFGIITIDNSIFDLTGITLFDGEGNQGRIFGGISHDHLSDLRLAATIRSEKILALKTAKNENPLYYGTGIGKLDAEFTGPFNQVDILVDATTAPGSKISIPISYDQNVSNSQYIKFINKNQDTISFEPQVEINRVEGLNLTMNLNVTESADMEIIFDENSGNILEGNGNGNLKIVINREGDFNMFGSYEINRGKYLYTLFNVINKPFILRQGGTISWNGDPFEAIINVEAEYERSADLTNFLIEYADQITSDLNSPTDVQLIMELSGLLLKPNINFDILFPDLTGELRNYSDNKLSVLRADQNALNQQVFGLIVLGNFIPSSSSNPFGNKFISNSGLNTLSEFISNQVSNYLSEFLWEAISDLDFYSGINLDLTYNAYRNSSAENVADDPFTIGEVKLKVNNRLFDDKLFFNAGANYRSLYRSASYIAGDWEVGYVLSDGELSIRFYQKSDETFEGRKNKYGIGLKYRKEMNSLFNFKSSLKKDIKDIAGTN